MPNHYSAGANSLSSNRDLCVIDYIFNIQYAGLCDSLFLFLAIIIILHWYYVFVVHMMLYTGKHPIIIFQCSDWSMFRLSVVVLFRSISISRTS